MELKALTLDTIGENLLGSTDLSVKDAGRVIDLLEDLFNGGLVRGIKNINGSYIIPDKLAVMLKENFAINSFPVTESFWLEQNL